ncbi:Protein pecanex [Lucilia cuprina]|nr:Protein pecanex [Lucilia cuprina]
MKVMHVGEEEVDMAASVDKAINEISAENSMVSIDNVNSIIDLKVDVHRKNSSESIELMFYAPSMLSGNSQQDQQSLAGTASNSKSIRSSYTLSHNNNNNNSISLTDPQAKYISVYPKDNSPIASTSSNCNSSNIHSTHAAQNNAVIGPKPPHLIRKSSEIVRGHQRRRLERQSSLDAAAESAIVAKLLRQSSDTTSNTKMLTAPSNAACQGNAEKCDSFLHAQLTKAGTSASSTTTAATGNLSTLAQAQRSNTTISNTNALTGSSSALKSTRLQRHRSSETHDERLKQQQRGSSMGATGAAPGGGIFLSIHHENGHHYHHYRHHHTHRRGGSGGAPPIASSGSVVVLGSGVNTSDSFDVDDMELGLGGSANVVAHGSHLSGDGRMRALPSWILGSSSDVFIEDDSFTKSDLGIEQLDDRSASSSTRVHPHANQYRLNHPHQTARGANITKDPIYTISALQLHKRPRREGAIKRRRHSNATTLFKTPTDSSSNVGSQPATTTTVRRIKSAALEVACPRPSVSNLCPHPNSVEAINGQQQIKNPQNALLPPPSKCLVRNPHLNLCPKFGGSFGGSSTNSSLDFGSTNALIDPVFELKEQKEKQTKLEVKESEDAEKEEAKDIKTKAEDVMDDESLGAVGGVCPHHFLHSHNQRQHHHSAESDVGQILNDNKNDEEEEESEQLNGDNDTDNNDEEEEDEDEDDEEEDDDVKRGRGRR